MPDRIANIAGVSALPLLNMRRFHVEEDIHPVLVLLPAVQAGPQLDHGDTYQVINPSFFQKINDDILVRNRLYRVSQKTRELEGDLGTFNRNENSSN